MPSVSVLMPVYNAQAYISRALESLFNQSYSDWELVLIDDGSTDQSGERIAAYLPDPRIHFHRFDINRGLGAALNAGLDHAKGSLIAYLPADDIYYLDHLSSLVDCINADPGAVMAYSGARHHYNKSAVGQIPGFSLQLVQVIHRKTPERWMEREEQVTDDLERMFWHKLDTHGSRLCTDRITCEWVDHPHQLHKLLREPIGGINLYRQRFDVQHPLRFHTMVGNKTDEVEHYRQFRERLDTPAAADALKILLVGELAYNPERILALEELGHQLYGLWMPDPYWYNTVGPLPFGHVQDLPRDNWQSAVRDLKPDLIYALLNWQAVPFVLEVQQSFPDIPLVWHFKEGPFICLEKGTWDQLVEIYANAHGLVYSSPEMQAWTEALLPWATQGKPSHILDGDLPKREWFTDQISPRLSEKDSEFHTVVPGRPIGLHPHNVVELAEQGIHLHFYGNFTHGQWLEWIEKTQRMAPDHIHLHGQVDQEGWVSEFSQYDAGWLHFFESNNYGDIWRANWDDLNYPARIATLVAAGLPLLQRRNTGHLVASQNLVQKYDIGLYFENMVELREQLEDRSRMEQIRSNVWRYRPEFTFDHHAGKLVDFFRTVLTSQPVQERTPPVGALLADSGSPPDLALPNAGNAGSPRTVG